MGMTIAEKIIAAAAGVDSVKPGDIYTVQLDHLMSNDGTTHLTVDMYNNKLKNPHIADTKKLVFIVVEFLLAIFKNFCQSELLICYHVGISPLGGLVDSFSQLYFTINLEEIFYFNNKKMPYLCGFWRFANAY